MIMSADDERMFDELIDAIDRIGFVFWTCPKRCRGYVEWNDDRTDATCMSCGTKKSDGSGVMDKVRIFFEDYHHDGCDKVVEATMDEWDRMIAPAVTRNFPIDAGTIDEELFEELYGREAVDVTLSELKKIERVVPMC